MLKSLYVAVLIVTSVTNSLVAKEVAPSVEVGNQVAIRLKGSVADMADNC